jgi:hypothetical protein
MSYFTVCESSYKPEQVGAAVTPHLYSVGARFTFRLEHHKKTTVFVVLLSCSREMTGEYLDDNKTGRCFDEVMIFMVISQFLIYHQFSYKNVGCGFKVCRSKSVHYHTIQINQPT